jgi:acyl transferase domain-containing protein/NRPS condensation-like uncharacterized protein/acyl carrier protein
MPTETRSGSAVEPLAIVGAGCRFPGGVTTPDEFWTLLAEGRDTITEGPPEAWRREALAHPDANPFGGYLDSVDGFDWRAFHTSPREARFMDPQQRLALEVAWEAFEHAGIPFDSLAGSRAAVAVGIMWPDYAKLQARDMGRLDGYTVTGGGFAYAANRISAFFDLVGPSLSLDVMCASGLAAVHLVCQSIWSGESDMGLAAGVNLILSPDTNVAMTKARILSPDGRCKTFDARANGFGRGEGAGAVVIKPAVRAAEDGDRVMALIRGTAFNHSGRNEWIMAPSREAQARAVTDACRRAGVRPADLDYVEMHGTGTEKGDPIEAAALGDTVGAGRPADRPCRVGSVKTNIGHLDSAAGIAGLVKAALALQHRQIPPSLHFSEPNPAIDLDALRLEVQDRLGDWPDVDGRPRLAGVACTGLGAANAHVVLEGAPEPRPAADARPRPLLVPVSAESDAALGELLGDYANLLRGPGAPDLRDLAYTAGERRTHRAARAAVTGSSVDELAEALDAAASGVARRGKRRAEAGAPAFVFSGQNCSWAGMGRGLLDEPAFRETLERCSAEIERRAGWSLIEAIEQEDPRIAADGPPSHVQLALCALQLSLTALWRAWGIEPAAVVGHSVGEIAAAAAAGAFGVEDAIQIALERGAVMDALHGRGRTAAVALPAEVVAERIAPLGDAVWVAGVNAPAATVVAGEPDAVERLVDELEADRVQATLLKVQSAFHGGGHAALASDLEARLAEVDPGALAIPMVSTYTGEPLAGGAPDAAYWADQMLSPVRFRDAVSRLVEDGHRVFVEVAPHGVLRSAVAASLREAEVDGTVVTSLKRGGEERADMLRGLARLYELGHAVDWRAVNGGPGRVVTLPRYRWQHQRLWLDEPSQAKATADGAHPLLGRHVELGHADGAHMWEGALDVERLPWLLEHRIDGLAVLPGSGYVELALAAVEQAAGWTACELRHLRFERALVLDDREPTRIQTLLEPEGEGFRLSVHGSTGEGWARHVSAVVIALDGAHESSPPPSPPDAAPLDAEDCYAGFVRQGVDYGPAFRGIARAWTSEGGVLAELHAPPSIAGDMAAYRHHPALLDAWMHVVALAGGTGTGGFMPTEIASLRVHAPAQAKAWSAVSLRDREAGAVTGDLTVTDDTGRTLVEGLGLRLRQLGSAGEAGGARRYEVEWRKAGEPAARRELTGSWLVLADRGGVGEHAAALLRERGAAVTVARAGELLPAGERFDSVLHLLGLDAPAGLPREADAAEDAHRLTTESLLELARTLDDTPVTIVTRGAQPASGDVVETPLAAVAWGLGRTLAQEIPSLYGGLVDLDPAASAGEAGESLIDCLERDDREDQRALRGGHVLVPRLVESGPPPEGDLPHLRADGAYLVTGGLGGLGGATARRLAERGADHLVLVGRTPVAELGPRVAILRELDELGATVHVAVADIGEPGSLHDAIAALRADGLPPIRGVVHAAGVDRRDSLEEMTGEAARRVMRPKVEGTLALHHALEDEPLDFFVIFSSIAALLSSPRMGHYSAGNAFQASFAAHRRALGKPAQALYWGIWGEVGMAVASDGGPLSLRGHRSLSTELGMELLDGAMHEPARDLALFEMNWAEWRRFYPRSAGAPLLERIRELEAPAPRPEARAAAPPASTATPSASASAADGSLADRVVALVADVLKLPSVDPEESLSNLGFDSLMAAELRVRIQDEHGVRIPMLRILEAPSIAALAAAVVAASGGEPVSTNGSEPSAVEPAAPAREPAPAPPPAPKPAPERRVHERVQADVLDEFMVAVDDVAAATVHSEVRVEGRLDAGRLAAAIREAVEAHPIARARLALARPLDRHYQWDLSQPLLTLPLEEVDCEDDESLALARERFLNESPALDTPGPFKVLLAHHPGGDALILNAHHAAGDGVAGFRFMTSIVRAYAGEPDPLPDVDPLAVREVAKLVGTSAAERGRRARGAANLLRRVARPPARVAAPAPGGRPGYRFELFTLTPEQVEEVLDRGPRGATLNDVLLGALAVTIRRWNERHGAPTGDVHIMMPVNVRPPAWSNDVFGNFAPWAPVRISPREHADLGSAATAAAARTRRIKESGIAGLVVDMNGPIHLMPVTWARRVASKLPARIGVDTAMLSNIGHVERIPARLGDAGQITAIWGTPPGYPPMNAAISIAAFASKLFVGFRYTRAAFDAAGARDFALTYRDTLLGHSGDSSRARRGDPASKKAVLEATA